eukprot:843711-Pleurochrysis_carterae.AAC.1
MCIRDRAATARCAFRLNWDHTAASHDGNLRVYTWFQVWQRELSAWCPTSVLPSLQGVVAMNDGMLKVDVHGTGWIDWTAFSSHLHQALLGSFDSASRRLMCARAEPSALAQVQFGQPF